MVRVVAVYLSLGYLPTPEQLPGWYFALGRLNPVEAYLVLSDALIDGVSVSNPFVTDPPAGLTAFYVDPWFGVIVLASWGALAVALALRRFKALDLP